MNHDLSSRLISVAFCALPSRLTGCIYRLDGSSNNVLGNTQYTLRMIQQEPCQCCTYRSCIALVNCRTQDEKASSVTFSRESHSFAQHRSRRPFPADIASNNGPVKVMTQASTNCVAQIEETFRGRLHTRYSPARRSGRPCHIAFGFFFEPTTYFHPDSDPNKKE